MQVAPYLESEQFPRGKRVLLAVPACVLMIGPYGSLRGDGPDNPITYAVLLLALAAGAALIGLAIAQPRRRVTIDGATQLITITQTAPLPRVGQDRAERAFDAVRATHIEAGTPAAGGRAARGFHPVLDLTDGSRIVLRAQPTEDHAQDVIEHLVLLGLPGASRSTAFETQLRAEPPPSWL